METETYVACPFCRGAPGYHFAHCPMHDPKSCTLCGKIGSLSDTAQDRTA